MLPLVVRGRARIHPILSVSPERNVKITADSGNHGEEISLPGTPEYFRTQLDVYVLVEARDSSAPSPGICCFFCDAVMLCLAAGPGQKKPDRDLYMRKQERGQVDFTCGSGTLIYRRVQRELILKGMMCVINNFKGKKCIIINYRGHCECF